MNAGPRPISGSGTGIRAIPMIRHAIAVHRANARFKLLQLTLWINQLQHFKPSYGSLLRCELPLNGLRPLQYAIDLDEDLRQLPQPPTLHRRDNSGEALPLIRPIVQPAARLKAQDEKHDPIEIALEGGKRVNALRPLLKSGMEIVPGAGHASSGAYSYLAPLPFLMTIAMTALEVLVAF